MTRNVFTNGPVKAIKQPCHFSSRFLETSWVKSLFCCTKQQNIYARSHHFFHNYWVLQSYNHHTFRNYGHSPCPACITCNSCILNEKESWFMLPVSLHLATVLIHGTRAFQSYQVILINKTKTAQQPIGNGRGSMALLAQWLSCETLTWEMCTPKRWKWSLCFGPCHCSIFGLVIWLAGTHTSHFLGY